MNASIFPESGEWLLVLNPTEPDHVSADAAANPSSASAFDKCWTGETWADTPSEGQRFESKIQAAAYLQDHWQRMENRAAALHDPIPAPSDFPVRGL